MTPTFKSGRTSQMVWGAFAGTKKSQLIAMPKDRRTAKDFVEIVYEGELRNFMDKISNSVLMEDGAPVHRSRVSGEWQQQHMVEKLNWPPNSPDLNPIENVWKILKDAVQHYRKRPRTLEEMNKALQEEWKAFSPRIFERLLQSMQERMEDVIKNHGGHTHS